MFDDNIFPLPTLAFVTGDDVAELDLKRVEIGVVLDGFISASLTLISGILHVHLLVQGIVLGRA